MNLLLTLAFIATLGAWHTGQATSIGKAWSGHRYGSSGLLYKSDAPYFASHDMLHGTIVLFRNPRNGKEARLKCYDHGVKQNHFDLSDKYVRYLCGNRSGCRIEYKIIDSSHACKGYRCLKRK